MGEDFLHYIWNHKKLAINKLQTVAGEPITIIRSGQHNLLAGPDFFNAQLQIGDQHWAGNVELHLKSSDWYVHGHETDTAYDSVILHIVWEHDVAVFRTNKQAIPTLVLKDYVSTDALANYQELFKQDNSRWIPCATTLKTIPHLTLTSWLDRLYLERLEQKTIQIQELLNLYQNDWEAVLFSMLAQNFGTKINKDAFASLATALPFTVIRKCVQHPFQLEALLLGMGGLIPDDSTDSYALQLEGEYEFVKHKFNLTTSGILPIQFFKLRPPNFPTIRLSQLAQVYTTHPQLFQKILELETKHDFYTLFKIQASAYWDTHFSFGTPHKKRAKKLSKAFIDLVLINTIVPIRFAYAKYKGIENQETLLDLMRSIRAESNSIIDKFDSLGLNAKQALDTQALLELKNNFCYHKRCLQCGIGNWLMSK